MKTEGDLAQQMKVLLVDDEEEFVWTLAERLRLKGFEVETASSGEDALRVAAAYSPEIVILDVVMPGLGGMLVLRQIKQQYPRIQVILLTGQGSTKVGMEGMRLGASDYLMKPVSIEQLISKIQAAAMIDAHP